MFIIFPSSNFLKQSRSLDHSYAGHKENKNTKFLFIFAFVTSKALKKSGANPTGLDMTGDRNTLFVSEALSCPEGTWDQQGLIWGGEN